MRIAIQGDRLFRAAINDISTGLREYVEDAVAETVFEIEGNVKARIQRSPASGRLYQKYQPRRVHRASAPGEAPATDTGNLVNSIYTDLQGLTGTVGSRIAYAAYLEYGTRHIARRPAWEPEIEAQKAKFANRVKMAIRTAMR